MTEYTFKKNLLPYPLKYLPSDGGVDTSSFVLNDPSVEPASNNWYVLCLTPDELQALRDIINIGAPIAYPQNYVTYWQKFAQMQEFPNEIPLDSCMDLCQLILDCINSTESLQEVIANFADGSNISSTDGENAGNLASELVNNPLGCNDDIIYGMTTQLVEFADRLCKDLFEQIDASQLSATNVGYIFKLIPFVETLPIDEAFELTDKLVDDIETAYLSASTELLKTSIACDLFCIAKDNGCTLTLEQVRDYFEEQSGVVFTYTNVLTFITDFLSGTFIGNAAYYAMNTLFFQTLAFGGKFLEYVFADYLKTIQTMYNDPNPDWNIDCATCIPTWTHTFDFTVNDGGFVSYPPAGHLPFGVYIPSTGWSFEDKEWDTPPTTWARAISLRRNFTSSNITEASFTYNHTQGTWYAAGTALTVNARLVDVVQMTYVESSVVIADGSGLVATVTGDVTADNVRLFIDSSRQNVIAYDGSCLITSCTIKGTGTNPFI